MSAQPPLPSIKSLTLDDFAARLGALGQPAYRAKQVLQWLYVHRVTSWDSMTNLPRALRDQLRQPFTLNTLELVRKQGASDTTQKFLWKLVDGALIESVLIPASPALYGEASDRHTLCVSTQVGCAYGCKFCASGLDGWKRNLGVEEIVEQVLAVERVSSSEFRVSSSELTGARQPGTQNPEAETPLVQQPETRNPKPAW